MYTFSIIYFVYKMYLVKLVFNSFINPFTTKCRFCLQAAYKLNIHSLQKWPLRLCLATATHNLKWLKIIHISKQEFERENNK